MRYYFLNITTCLNELPIDISINMQDSEKITSHYIKVRIRNPLEDTSPTFTTAEFLEVLFLDQLGVEDIAAMDWQAIEQAALNMRPTEKLQICPLGIPAFEWFLDALPAGKVFPKLFDSLRVEIVHLSHRPRVTAETVMPICSLFSRGKRTRTL